MRSVAALSAIAGLNGGSDAPGRRLNDYLHVIEFRASDCGADELFDAFVKANEAVAPAQIKGLRNAAEELSRSSSNLTITKCEIDPGDPDAHWRWPAEGMIASTAMFEDSEPKFASWRAAYPDQR